MRRITTCAAVAAALLFACAPSFAQIFFPPGNQTAETKTPRALPAPVKGDRVTARPLVLYNWKWKGVTRHVFRSSTEFLQFAREHSNYFTTDRQPPVPRIVDWNDDMVILAGMKAGPTSGYKVTIGSIHREDGHIVVPVLEARPGPDDLLVPIPGQDTVVSMAAIHQSLEPIRMEETSVLLGPAPFLARVGMGLDPSAFEALTVAGGQATVVRAGDAEQVRIQDVNGQPTMRLDEVSGGPTFRFTQSAVPVGKDVETVLAKAARENGFLKLKDRYGKPIPGIDQRQRTIRVTVDDRMKEVTVLDDPSSRVPLAFEKMWKAFRDARKRATTYPSTVRSITSALPPSSWSISSEGFSPL